MSRGHLKVVTYFHDLRMLAWYTPSQPFAFDDKLTVHRGGCCTAAAKREIRIACENEGELR